MSSDHRHPHKKQDLECSLSQGDRDRVIPRVHWPARLGEPTPGSARDLVSKKNKVEINRRRHSSSSSGFYTSTQEHIHKHTDTHSALGIS